MAANCGASSASNGLKMRLEYEKMIEILDFLASGKKKIEAAKFFNLPRGTVSNIFKDIRRTVHDDNHDSDDGEVPSQIQLTKSEALLQIRELQDYFTKDESTLDEFFHLSALENV